jgi:hypothetical protein
MSTCDQTIMPVPIRVPLVAKPPAIDGTLSDEAWQQAVTIEGFRPFLGGDYQNRIDEIPTQVKLCWTPDAFFIAFICQDDEIYLNPPDPGAGKVSLHQGDVCEVFLDPLARSTLWFELQVNALSQSFACFTAMVNGVELQPDGQVTWPCLKRSQILMHDDFELAGLEKAVTRHDDHWIVEIKIPAVNIARYHGWDTLKPMMIRANFVRYNWEPYDGPPPPGGPPRRLTGMLWQPGNCIRKSPIFRQAVQCVIEDATDNVSMGWRPEAHGVGHAAANCNTIV